MTGLRPAFVEAGLVAYLKPLLAVVQAPAPAVTVATRIPNPRPAWFVRVGRVGGDEANMIQERPVVLFECWAPDEVSAWKLAARVYGYVQGRDLLTVGGIELGPRSLSSPVNYPDPASTSPRYQFTGTFTADLVKESAS